MPYIIQTSQVSKTVGKRELIHEVDMHVKKGEIYGFLGPNGAGKTTMMRMLTNLWKPTTGSIELFGEALTEKSYEVFKRMGCIIEFPTFYDHLSAVENLKLHCEYMGYNKPGAIEEVLDLFGLSSASDKPVKNFSLGMRQRLGIARAMISKPELLILDEPTNGLDPAGIKMVRDIIHMLSRDFGITVLISTHILSEVESIADTIGVIKDGRMIEEVSMKEIAEKNSKYIQVSVDNAKKASIILSDILNISNFKILDDENIRIYDEIKSVSDISKNLSGNDILINSITRQSESLEDYFMKLTGEVC